MVTPGDELRLREALASTLAGGGGAAALGVVADRATVIVSGDASESVPLASVSKIVTSLAVLVAVEEGVVDLDDAAGPTGSTIRHLLSHASGLPFEEGPTAAPERRRLYSNAGFRALGEFVAERAEMPFEDYARMAVCRPLGLQMDASGDPASGMCGSLDDLLALGVELLEPTLVDTGTLAEATSVQFGGLDGVLPGFGMQRPNDWGLGFELRDGKSPHWTGTRNSSRTFGHFGQTGTFLWVDPEARVACGYLGGRPFGDWAKVAWPTVSDAVLAALR